MPVPPCRAELLDLLASYSVTEECAAGRKLADIARELEAKAEQRDADHTCNGLLSREVDLDADRLGKHPVVFVGERAAESSVHCSSRACMR